MKILYISQYYPPEMGAPSARVSELSRHWVDAGHEVTVLTGFPNHPTGKIAPAYRKKFRRLILKENISGINVIRTWLLPFPNRKSYERILNYASFCFSAALTGMFLNKPDVVIATSPQLLVGLSGWFVAVIKRAPFVFEVRDLWPESLTAVGLGNDRSLIHRALAAIAKFLYRKADRIVVVTPAFKTYLETTFQIAARRISIVQNGVETDLFDPRCSTSHLKQSYGDKFVVSYIGTMGMAHGLQTLLDSATALQSSNPEILFLCIGEGSDKERIIKLAKVRSLSNVRFINEQPRDTIPAYIGASDVCLVLLKESDVFKTVIPTKMLEFMSCCRPVILGVDGQARTIMEEAQAGIFVRPQNVSELSNAILRLAADASLRDTLGRNGRKYILQHFSRAETAHAYIKLLHELAGVSRVPQSLAA